MQQNEWIKVTLLMNQAPEMAEFAISEIISIFSLYGISHEQLFDLHYWQVPEIKDIKSSDFPTYPFVETKIPNIEFRDKILERAILTHDVLYYISRSENIDYLHLNLEPQSLKYINDPDISCKVEVISSGKRLVQEERVQILNQVFGKLQCPNKIDLSNPDITYYILLTHKNQYVLGYSFQKKYKKRERNFARHYELPNRIYLGPVSLAHDLAFLMANQAQVKENDFVLDPFAGTGSSLVACAHYGALCFGAEIDGFLLQGHCIGQLNVKSTFYKEELIGQKPYVNLNFKQYNLEIPSLIRTDVNSRNYSPYADGFFDAIICDPPYGIRASIQQDAQDKTASRTLIYKRMFEISRRLLRQGGRLVFLYPIWKQTKDQLQNEDGFKLIDSKEQTLADKRSRLLVTMQRQ